MKIIHTSKKFLKVLACVTMLLTAHQAQAQQVTVDASIDSLQLLIGEQAKIKLEVSMDANQKLILPALRDTIVRGVEILDIAKPDTQILNDGGGMLSNQYSLSLLSTRHFTICRLSKCWLTIRHTVQKHWH